MNNSWVNVICLILHRLGQVYPNIVHELCNTEKGISRLNPLSFMGVLERGFLTGDLEDVHDNIIKDPKEHESFMSISLFLADILGCFTMVT